MAEQSQAVTGTVGREQVAAPPNLARKVRWNEALIQGFLFFCGAISIISTIGIVIILGQEALRFFTTSAIQDVNKTLTADISETDTVIPFTTSGFQVLPGDILFINGEEMLVESVAEGSASVVVVRGYEDTPVLVHANGVAISRITRPDLIRFFTGTEWQPQLSKFGVLPLVNATLMTSGIAMLVALPLGLATAVYLSEYASYRVRNILKPMLEILAGVPTVVYGYFALTFVTPILQNIFGNTVVDIYNTASAGLVIGILTLPIVATLSEDALTAVPRSLREASFALGATRFETALQVVVPAAISGIAAAAILAISRAAGETMVVALAAGAGPNFTFNPFKGAETMTGHIVRISGGDLSYDSIDYNSLFAIGLLLFFITLTLNIISRYIVVRFQEKYD